MRLTLTWARYTEDSVEHGGSESAGFLALAQTIEQAVEALGWEDDDSGYYDCVDISVYQDGDGVYHLTATQSVAHPRWPLVIREAHLSGTRREAKRFLIALAKARLIRTDWSLDVSARCGSLRRAS